MNAVKEIKDKCSEIEKTTSDIDWIGSRDGQMAMNWNDFERKFSNVEYDDGYGWPELAQDLVVIFNDKSWLEREEYDGAEWWEYKKCPVLISKGDFDYIDTNSTGCNGWSTLNDIKDWKEEGHDQN